ncbi:MAG: chemotaxis response regulator protein-glutamate methylesterase [Polyangiaceae bacterium]
MSAARVLVVDDSALMRRLLTEILGSDPSLEVVGTAPDPIKAWTLIQTLRPDVLTLDVEMPKMDGISFLERLMRAHPMPVVMVSSRTTKGADTTLRALELGAVDFVAKPAIDVERGLADLAREIVAKVKAASSARLRYHKVASPAGAGPAAPGPSHAAGPPSRPATPNAAPPSRPHAPPPSRPIGSISASAASGTIIAIGSSTGGTEALREVLAPMPANSPGIVVVQHMPEHFTKQFAARLDHYCQMRVKEAENGDAIVPGQILIAPGSVFHMEVARQGASSIVRLVDAPPLRHHRPAVDMLFNSCAKILAAKVIGVILTGMGEDGAQGLLAMHRAGARTIAQDEASCVVFGMPKAAIQLGAADYVLSLERIPAQMLALASGGAPQAHAAAR